MTPDLKRLQPILERYPREESSLIMILQDVQAEYNYLPPEVLKVVAKEIDVPKAKVFGVATFYKAFSLEPRGKEIIKVCMGTACHVRGAPLIRDELERMLGIKAGQTTRDLKFTLELVNCVGACAMAPVAIIGDTYYPNLTPDKLKKIIKGKRTK
jgi:NADH:ubiquinone oxidoreductase subunit E